MVIEEDVAGILKERLSVYEAILLDVDNGPDALASKGNAWLYSRPGLAAAFGALRPGGVLAVWSAGPDQAFAGRLAGAGFTSEEIRVSARACGKGGRHTIWMARR